MHQHAMYCTSQSLFIIIIIISITATAHANATNGQALTLRSFTPKATQSVDITRSVCQIFQLYSTALRCPFLCCALVCLVHRPNQENEHCKD